MKRSKHSLSHYRLLTFDMGELIPVCLFEVLPGDSIQQSTSALVRVSPLLAPVMHPVQVRIHHWFVPHRLVWDEWEDFITGGPAGLGAGESYPTIDASNAPKGSLSDYLGIPTGVPNVVASALPFRSYNLIYNEFYRDQDLVAEVEDNGSVRRIAWEKDYFTSARPWPQKGPDVSLPLGSRAPVKGIAKQTQVFGAGPYPGFDSQGPVSYSPGQSIGTASADLQWIVKGTGTAGGLPDIYADLTSATATNINDVRKAFALQRYQEARAQYGSRYTEYLRYLGIRSSDARLQRPEYLGGGKATISFSEVLQTGPGSDPDVSVVGELKGHGISALRSRRYRRFFEEHGLVISLMSVRPRTMYMNGLERMWSRRTKEDYWQKELELIGQQPISNREVHLAALEGNWGFQNRYSEYRHLWSKVSGDFRDTLNFWHMARDFATAPVLNQSFVECDPTKRINAVQTEDTLWVMCSHSIQARRLVTKSTIGRVL